MMRILIAVAAMMIVSSSAYAGDSSVYPSVNLGEKLEGEIGGPVGRCFFTNGRNYQGYTYTASITLKAGQSVTVSAVVVGKTRNVSLELCEPTGKTLGFSDRGVKSASLTVEEVNTSGKYTIWVYSDLIGPFTLRRCAVTLV